MTQADTTPTPSTPRRRNPAATKEKLIRSALELFTTVGFHGSTTPQIASNANVAEGTIYRHFSGKSHMFNEIYRGTVRLYARIFNDTDEMANCRKRLETIARHWFALARRDAHIAMLVFVMPVNRLLDEESRTLRAGFKGRLGKIMASGKSDGMVRPGSAEVWADVWLQLISLAVDRITAGGWGPDDDYVGQVIDAAWKAVCSDIPVQRPLTSAPLAHKAPSGSYKMRQS